MQAGNAGYSASDVELNAPVVHGNADTEDDSDARQLFELPKRKVHRPPSLAFKRKIGSKKLCCSTLQYCCGNFVTAILPIVVAVFIVSTMLCLAFLLIGISGMKKEISLLKIKLNNANEAKKTSLIQTSYLRDEFDGKLKRLEDQDKLIAEIKGTIDGLGNKLAILNATMKRMQDSPTFHLSKRVDSLSHDIDSIKSGMADTGADIEKLNDENKKLEDKILLLQQKNDILKTKVFNLTVMVSLLEDKPIPSAVTTPKTLIITLTPDEDQPITRKEAKAMRRELEEQQKRYYENATIYVKEKCKLEEMASSLNRSWFNRLNEVVSSIDVLKEQFNRSQNKADVINATQETSFINDSQVVVQNMTIATPLETSVHDSENKSQALVPMDPSQNLIKSTQGSSYTVRSGTHSAIPTAKSLITNVDITTPGTTKTENIMQKSTSVEEHTKVLSRKKDLHDINQSNGESLDALPSINELSSLLDQETLRESDRDSQESRGSKHLSHTGDSEDLETVHKYQDVDPAMLKELMSRMEKLKDKIN